MGVANDHSIAWGIARSLSAAGAEIAFSYQTETLKKRVEPLAKELGSKLILPCDVESSEQVTDFFDKIGASYLENPQDEKDLKNEFIDNFLKNNKSMTKEELTKILSFTEMES